MELRLNNFYVCIKQKHDTILPSVMTIVALDPRKMDYQSAVPSYLPTKQTWLSDEPSISILQKDKNTAVLAASSTTHW